MRDVFLGVLAAFLCCPILVWSQSAGTGALTGTVTDQSGAVIGGAYVKVINDATGETRTTTTQTQGEYVVTFLPPGTYRLEVSKQGFKTTARSNIHIDVTETTKLQLRLEIGTVVAPWP